MPSMISCMHPLPFVQSAVLYTVLCESVSGQQQEVHHLETRNTNCKLKGFLPFSRSLTAEIAYFDGKSVRPFLCQLLPGIRIQHACQPRPSRFSLVIFLDELRSLSSQ
ncbi:hypothetical protein HCH54_007485 [Aspergillus fumigatus]